MSFRDKSIKVDFQVCGNFYAGQVVIRAGETSSPVGEGLAEESSDANMTVEVNFIEENYGGTSLLAGH